MIAGAPHFDIDALPVDPTSGYIDAAIAEEQRVCNPIDKRLAVLEAEFCDLVKQVKRAEKDLAKVGWWQRLTRRFDLSVLNDKLERNRALRNTLYDARWRRTFG